MFKYTIVVAALAVSAAVDGSVTTAPTPTPVPTHAPASAVNTKQEPIMAATGMMMYGHKKMAYKPEKVVLVPEIVETHEEESYNIGGLIEAGMLGLLEALTVPKKLIGFIVGKLKSINLKKVLKATLIGAVVTVLGAIAAVAVAGLVSIVSGICALIPYVKFFLGKNPSLSDSQLDIITDFVLGALSKYEKHH